MKKLISCVLALSMIFTGVATASCFAETKQTNVIIKDSNGKPINLNFQISGGNAKATSEAKANSKATASSGSRAKRIAKIVLAIILIYTAKKYTKTVLTNIKPALKEIKGQFAEVAKSLKELIGQKLEEMNQVEPKAEPVATNTENLSGNSIKTKFLEKIIGLAAKLVDSVKSQKTNQQAPNESVSGLVRQSRDTNMNLQNHIMFKMSK